MKYLARFVILFLFFIFNFVEFPSTTLSVKAERKYFNSDNEAAVSLEEKTQLPIIKSLEHEELGLVSNQQQYADYTKLSTPVKIVVVTASSGLRVRKGPSTKYSKIRVLSLNSRVDVLEEKNDWYRISKEEWICKHYTKGVTELDNVIYSWYYIPNKNHQVPTVKTQINISKYGGGYIGDINYKGLYLTFDLDHEAGYTSDILNVLKLNEVEAVFFISKDYLICNVQLVKRMLNEGHLIGMYIDMKNYSTSKLIAENKDKFKKDILEFASAFKKATGKEIPRLLRPSVGDYSELSLYLAGNLGYKTIFWSFAYYDYDEENQPLIDFAFSRIVSGTHNGAVLLLNGNSRANSMVLNSAINAIKHQGYEFLKFSN